MIKVVAPQSGHYRILYDQFDYISQQTSFSGISFVWLRALIDFENDARARFSRFSFLEKLMNNIFPSTEL